MMLHKRIMDTKCNTEMYLVIAAVKEKRFLKKHIFVVAPVAVGSANYPET